MKIRIKRVYEKPESRDGRRILVDRVWPRGVKKEQAKIDLWLKDIAPSMRLRKWFGHDPEKWDEFRKRYRDELGRNREAVSILRKELEKGPVTLVYSAKDEAHNQAVVIRENSSLFR